MSTIKNPFNFFKKANKSFNLYLGNYKKINSFFRDYRKDRKNFNSFFRDYRKDRKNFNSFFRDYSKDQETFDAFFKDYQQKMSEFQTFVAKKNSIIQATDNIVEYYSRNKDYFFNGEEHLFKNLMNTDHFFQMCFFNNIELSSYSLAENRIYLKTKDNIRLLTNNRFYTIETIFGKEEYSVPQLHQFEEFVVFDVGMNRGYAALKFASFDSCKKVYGFEIDNTTYDIALENFSINPKLSEKIKPYNFGLYDEDTELDFYYIPGYDGISTTKLEFANTQQEWVREKEQMKHKKAQVKEAGTVIGDIIEKNNINCNIVLKIDTEGAEHKIIDNLIDKGLLSKIDLIIGEVHLEEEDLDAKLDGFKKISKVYTKDGKIYSFCFVKEKFFKPLPRAEVNLS